jgi:hypothetical protein
MKVGKKRHKAGCWGTSFNPLVLTLPSLSRFCRKAIRFVIPRIPPTGRLAVSVTNQGKWLAVGEPVCHPPKTRLHPEIPNLSGNCHKKGTGWSVQ